MAGETIGYSNARRERENVRGRGERKARVPNEPEMSIMPLYKISSK